MPLAPDVSLTKGDVYKHNVSRAMSAATDPFWIDVAIVYNDGENIHYRLGRSSSIHQVPIDRFREICEVK